MWRILFLSLLGMAPLVAQTSQRDSAERYFELRRAGIGYMTREWQIYADSALLIDPANDEMWQTKAMPYLKSGNYAKAFEYLNKAVALNEQRWIAYRAFCKAIFLKDYPAALVDFEKADQNPRIAKYTMDHTFNFYRGLCHLGMKQYAKAIPFFEKSLAQVRKDNGEVAIHYLDLFYLGMAYYGQGNQAQALKYLKEAESRYKQLPEILYYLARIYQQQKKTFLATEYVKQAKLNYEQGYRITEDNVFYADYPAQISLVELNELAEKLGQP